LQSILDEDFFNQVSDEEVETIIWSVLYDEAREVTPDELQEMKQNHDKLQMEADDFKKLSNYILEVRHLTIAWLKNT